MNVYVGIGNTDNKLTQQEWSAFITDVEDVAATLFGLGRKVP